MTRASATLAAGLAAACLAAAGCGDGEGPILPSPAPAVSVSFAESRLELDEGQSAPVVLRYTANGLEEPLPVFVSADGTASAEDYALSAASVEVPAGPRAGELALTLTALPDLLLSEGEEVLTLRLAEYSGPGLEVVIRESGASPCPGVTARAAPIEAPAQAEWLETTLTTEWSGSGRGSGFDFLGPSDPDRIHAFALTQLGIRLLAWKRSSVPLRHEHRLEWLASAGDLQLGFRSGDCSGEPVVRCSRDGCALEP